MSHAAWSKYSARSLWERLREMTQSETLYQQPDDLLS